MTPHVAQTGILSLVADSGLMAKFVLLLLLASSVVCWAVIATKWRILFRTQRENEKFIAAFWNGKNIDEVIVKCEKFPHSSVASVFKSGVKELKRVSGGTSAENGSLATQEKMENVQRALMRSATLEISALEKNVSWLATTASAAPFVGLFGTVWGIMNSFQSIGASGAANLAVVAPGISEALITTATGIGAAIPAVIFYNYFLGKIRKVSIDMECFSQDFINIVQRSFMGTKKG